MNERLKNFQNPIGDCWHYPGVPGLIRVTLAQPLDKTIIPPNDDTVLEGRLLTVNNGTISETSNCLQILDSNDKPILLAFRFIKYVSGKNDKLVWVNPNYYPVKRNSAPLVALLAVIAMASMSCSMQSRQVHTADRNAIRHQIFALQKERTSFESKDKNLYSQDSIESTNEQIFALDDSLMSTN